MQNAVLFSPLRRAVTFGVTLLALSLLLPPAALAEHAPLNAFTARYQVGNDFLVAGRAELTLQPDATVEQGWSYRIETRPTGVFQLTGKGHIVEESHFREAPQQNGSPWLIPSRYQYRQDQEKQRSIDAEFNWNANALTFSKGGQAGSLALEPGLVDRLAVTLWVPELIASGEADIEVPVFDNGRIKRMRFVLDGRETLETEVGTFEALRVRSSNAGGSTREQITWFAPELGPIPLRIEQIKRGKLVARLDLQSIEQLDVASPTGEGQ